MASPQHTKRATCMPQMQEPLLEHAEEDFSKGVKTMTPSNISPRFVGMYGIPEAARYLIVTPPLANGHKLDPSRLRYWIRTSVPRIAPPIYPTRQRLITFLDLVSMRMVAVLRSRGIKLQEIRNTETWLRREFGLEWPFASRDLWTFGSDVFIEFADYLIAASRFGHITMRFIEDWLRKVELDMTFDVDDIASSWSPYNDVCLDPKIQFGEPCIDGTRIPTCAILSKVKAGDAPEIVATLYDVNITQIEHAIQWEERLVTA